MLNSTKDCLICAPASRRAKCVKIMMVRTEFVWASLYSYCFFVFFMGFLEYIKQGKHKYRRHPETGQLPLQSRKNPDKQRNYTSSPQVLHCKKESAAACAAADAPPKGRTRTGQAAAESPERVDGGKILVEVVAIATCLERQDLKTKWNTSTGATPRLEPAAGPATRAKAGSQALRSSPTGAAEETPNVGVQAAPPAKGTNPPVGSRREHTPTKSSTP
jgi:hypothetical protein